MPDQHPATLTDDPVLLRFRKALDALYGDRLERVVLYGSRARGDARPDSDYDVAVFLRDMGDLGAELHRLAHLSSDIIDETGEFVHAMPYRAGSYEERTPLMREIRIEGIDL
jgi:predicted nucleotidyltransferase